MSIEPSNTVESHLTGPDGAETVGRGMQFAVGVDEADTVVFTNLAIDAEHAEISAASGEWIVLQNTLAGKLIIGQKGTNGPRSDLARQPGAIKRIGNTAGENQLQRGLKVIGVLQKERALLREKDFKALVDRDLGLVRFDLPEIRVHGGIEHQAVFDHNL